MFCPPSPIYRRKEGGGCRPARPGKLGCFHQKAPPSSGTLRKAQVSLVAICTPLLCYLNDFVLKHCGTLRIMRRHLFSFWNVVKFYGLRNNARYPFGMLRNFTDYATMLVSRVLKGANKVQGPTASTTRQN